MLSPPSTFAPMVAKLARQPPLNDEERDALSSLPHRLAHLPRRHLIVREGEKVTQCCLLLSGFASRYKVAGSGAMQMLSIHLRGDLLDLHNSIVDTADHSIETLTDADVAFIPRQAIIDVAAQFSGVSRAFLKETVIDSSIAKEWLLNVGHRTPVNAYRICFVSLPCVRRLPDSVTPRNMICR